MNDEELLRYSRQILLPQLGMEGQLKIHDAHVVIIGMGGLGSPVAMYLAAAGVGHLTLVDHDCVDLSNLQRQVVHRSENIEQRKVESARNNLLALNPLVNIDTVDQQLDDDAMDNLVSRADVIVDATDNFTTRFQINHSCVKQRKPLVSGAAIRFEGQVSVFDMRRDDSPCYRCLYDDIDAEAGTCSENGILAPIVGVIGSIQATETLKLIANVGEPLVSQLLIFDGLHQDWRKMKLRKDPQCPVCANR